jgi:hypothetical protein
MSLNGKVTDRESLEDLTAGHTTAEIARPIEANL